MKSYINWGIIGLGKIARTFATDLLLSNNSKLHAVASRDIEKAKTFATDFHASKYYNSYEKLAQDPEVDVVYIATPHVFHFEYTMMCLKAGKNVLCEKAFGMNQEEVKTMISEAKNRNLFLMEAIWTRFIPATEKLLSLIEEGVIGEIKQIRADFGFKANPDPNLRLFNKKLGGGSLLDIGIYPVYLSLLLFGAPQKITAKAEISSTGVDSFLAAIFEYQNGQKSVLESSFLVDTPTEAYIFGEKGYLKMHSRFHHSEKISIHISGKEVQEIDMKYKGNGYYHQITEVENCLSNNQYESSKLPHNMSLQLIQTLDRIRKKINLKYD